MQVVTLDVDHHDFYCPVTGQQIFSEMTSTHSPACRGIWHGELADEPEGLSLELRDRWEHYLLATENNDEPVEIREFLLAIPRPKWIAFELRSNGLGHQPITATNYIVIDMNHCNDETWDAQNN